MRCVNIKRKFDEVEQAVSSAMETMTGYEKCLIKNKLLIARSRLVNYENLCVVYEAQVSMAKLDVEIATSDIDLLLQELQRGKRFKTGEDNSTMTTSTQTGSEPISSPTKSVSDTSRLSFDLPSVDLTSFPRHRLEKGQEKTSHGENAQELATSQGSKDSGYNSSQKSRISQETTTGYDSSSSKSLVTKEIQVDLPSNNTKEGDIEKVKCTKKIKPKKGSDTIGKTDTCKKDVLPSVKIKTKDKSTNEKPSKANEEVPIIDEKTQKIDNTRRKSVQRRQYQNSRHRKRDERKSGSYDRRSSTESRKETTDRFDLVKDMPKHREKTKDRKSLKEKCETKFDEKQNPNRNGDRIKPKNKPTQKSQNIGPRDTKNGKSSDDDKHTEEKKSEQAQNMSEQSEKQSEPVQKSNIHMKKITDPRIKPIRTKIESNNAKYKSKPSDDISCDSTLIIAEESMEIDTSLSNLIIDDFTPYEIPYNSPIRYTDFANNILSSVTVTDKPTTLNGLGNSIAQSTPFVRRVSTVEHSGSESQDLALNVPCSDPIEDQLTSFIRSTLANYNRDVAELNLSPESHTTTDKTTNLNEKNAGKNIDKDINIKTNDKTTKMNEENDHKTDRKPETPENIVKRTTEQNLMVKIPINRLPDTLVKIPVTTKTRQPCLTVTVNDAGVITIRPRSAENSNLPGPKPDKTVVESHTQNIQDIPLPDLKEPTIKTVKSKAQDMLSTPKTPLKMTSEMPNETASYMTEVKDQYYFDVDSPRLADEAPTHKNAVNLFRAFSLIMPPSPTFTMSSSSDKENCTSNTPSPPKVQKLPINKKLLNDSVSSIFHSHINYMGNDSKNDIHTRNKDYRNDIYSRLNDINTSHKNDISTNYRNDIPTNYKNDISTNYRNDIPTNYKNDIPTNYRNDIPTNYKNDITNHSKNKMINNISYTTKPQPVRRSKSISVTTRRTTKFRDAQPLPTRNKSKTPKPRTNRRKSLDDRAILRILKEPCSSISSKSTSPRSSGPTPKKDGMENIILFNISE